jgi:hypothetical protein
VPTWPVFAVFKFGQLIGELAQFTPHRWMVKRTWAFESPPQAGDSRRSSGGLGFYVRLPEAAVVVASVVTAAS